MSTTPQITVQEFINTIYAHAEIISHFVISMFCTMLSMYFKVDYKNQQYYRSLIVYVWQGGYCRRDKDSVPPPIQVNFELKTFAVFFRFGDSCGVWTIVMSVPHTVMMIIWEVNYILTSESVGQSELMADPHCRGLTLCMSESLTHLLAGSLTD